MRSTAWLLLGLLSACSYRSHAIRGQYPTSLQVPAPRIDRQASTVGLVSTQAVGFTDDEATRVRADFADALEELIKPRHPEDFKDARFRIKATLNRKGNWSYAYIAIPVAIVVGAPLHRVEATVELELEVGRVVYEGKATERVFAGAFYNYNTREKATAKAFRVALREALSAAGREVASR